MIEQQPTKVVFIGHGGGTMSQYQNSEFAGHLRALAGAAKPVVFQSLDRPGIEAEATTIALNMKIFVMPMQRDFAQMGASALSKKLVTECDVLIIMPKYSSARNGLSPGMEWKAARAAKRDGKRVITIYSAHAGSRQVQS